MRYLDRILVLLFLTGLQRSPPLLWLSKIDFWISSVHSKFLVRICNFIVHGLHSSHKIAFLLLFVIRAVYANIDDEELGEVMFSLSEFVHEFDDFDTEDDPDWDESSRDLFSVRLSCFLKALKIKFDSGQPILQAIIIFIETEFRKNEVVTNLWKKENHWKSQINLDITRMLKRVYIELDTGKPLLIVESGSLDTW